jgi:thioredoxin-related protein
MKAITVILVILLPIASFSQQPASLYNPAADAGKELEQAVNIARDQHKHVLIQVGGNWCSWCVKLHSFLESQARLDSILKSDFVLLRINYSPENKNEEVLAGLGFPQRFGFPVLVVLDEKGNRLHTQDTWYLELDKGYDPEKVERFLLSWNRTAVDPTSFK